MPQGQQYMQPLRMTNREFNWEFVNCNSVWFYLYIYDIMTAQCLFLSILVVWIALWWYYPVETELPFRGKVFSLFLKDKGLNFRWKCNKKWFCVMFSWKNGCYLALIIFNVGYDDLTITQFWFNLALLSYTYLCLFKILCIYIMC